jgi:hypothetical protein
LIISATTTVALVTLKPPPAHLGGMAMLFADLTLHINKGSRNSIMVVPIIARCMSWAIIPTLGPVIVTRTPVIIARALIITAVTVVITAIMVFIRTTIILARTVRWRAVRVATNQVGRGDKFFRH